MAASIAHWRPMVNGFSSFRPPSHEELVAVLRHADSETTADVFQVLGITTLVLHLDELNEEERARLGASEWREAGFVERFRSPQTAIWTLEPRRTPTLTDELRVETRMAATIGAGGTASVRLLFGVEEGQIYYDSDGGANPLHVGWLPLDADGTAVRQERRLAIPRVVVAKPQVKVDLQLTGPDRPGRYRLELHGQHFSVQRTVVVSARQDT